ncbi:hypothetical protein [Conexibacter woesei]|uniref:hypothetical protein n=1 Tax=Conexibacter woesei TaxID=191495 RepID=UPI000410AC04|nr:hypothetical protein [Conexibacter woesei]
MDIGPTISGIDAASMLADASGAQLVAGSISPDAQDLATPAVNLTLAGVSIDVQARVMQAQQDSFQSLLDVVA